MRRNLHTAHMNYKEREAYRLKRKDQIANEKSAKEETLNRLADINIAIEDAFKPEADRLFDQIVTAYRKAYLYVRVNGETYNAVRTAYTGYDIDANPIPYFNGRRYIGSSQGQYTPEYLEHKKKADFQSGINAQFGGTMMATICMRSLDTLEKLLSYAEKEATETVAANKYKLLDGVARYMGEYQTAQVVEHFVRQGVKGFQGDFTLNTDKGRRLFTCKAITAEGPIVSFHWRFIIHVKEI